MTTLLTIKLRLKDKHAAELSRQARVVNYVWNYCNETQQKAARLQRKWLTWIDLKNLTAGSSKELDLHSHTIQQVCIQYDRSGGSSHNKPWLRFRGRKSLGWVPFCQGNVRFDGLTFTFRGVRYAPMHLRDIPAGAFIRAGSFNADARGRWYINVPIAFPRGERSTSRARRQSASISDSRSWRHYRQAESSSRRSIIGALLRALARRSAPTRSVSPAISRR